MCVNVVLPAATKKAPRSLCLICHIPHRFQASWNILWITFDNYFWMRSAIRRRSNCSARDGVVAEGTPTAKNAKTNDSHSHPRRKRRENYLNYFPFYFVFWYCGYQVLSPRWYRLIFNIILQGHPGSSEALWEYPRCWPRPENAVTPRNSPRCLLTYISPYTIYDVTSVSHVFWPVPGIWYVTYVFRITSRYIGHFSKMWLKCDMLYGIWDIWPVSSDI